MNCRLMPVLFLIVACASPLELGESEAIGEVPDEIPRNADNPDTPEKVELGRLLFWDPILSGGRDVACAGCHHPDFAYADGIRVSIGVGGSGLGPKRVGSIVTERNSMTVLNTAFNGLHQNDIDPRFAPMFWDNRSESLEEQALEPIKSDVEMRGDEFSEEEIVGEVVQRLREIDEYRELFGSAFGSEGLDAERLAAALAAFQRSLIVADSSFDRFMRGDEGALTQKQKRGLVSFVSSGCVACHSGPMFSDFKLHRIGVPNSTEEERREGLRTASLRMVTKTAPYMHNGVYSSLEDAIEHYDGVDESLDPALLSIEAPFGSDIGDLVSFLEALSDGSFDSVIPASVPSGLTVGGN